MDMKERRDRQLAYISDEAVMEEQIRCRKILQRLNFADRSDFEGIAEIVKKLLGKSEGACINPHFTVIMVLISRWERISLQIITVRLLMWRR